MRKSRFTEEQIIGAQVIARLGKTYIRYVDDLAVFERNEADCLQTRDLIATELDRIGLTIPEIGAIKSKTEIKDPTQTLIFLGLEIYPQKSGIYAKKIPQFAFDDLKERLEKEVSFAEFEKTSSKNFQGYISWFENLKAGYRAAYRDATNLTHFQHVLDELVNLQKIKLLREVFGEDFMDKFDAKKLRFLGVVL